MQDAKAAKPGCDEPWIGNLLEMVQFADGGIVSKTLVDCPKANISLFAMKTGQSMSGHSAAQPASIHVLAEPAPSPSARPSTRACPELSITCRPACTTPSTPPTTWCSCSTCSNRPLADSTWRRRRGRSPDDPLGPDPARLLGHGRAARRPARAARGGAQPRGRRLRGHRDLFRFAYRHPCRRSSPLLRRGHDARPVSARAARGPRGAGRLQ